MFPNHGSNPCPLQWKHGVLPTGPPGKSQELVFYSLDFILHLLCLCRPSARPSQDPCSLHFILCQPCRIPQESSGPSSGPPSGWIIPASTASATNCQTGAVVSCFGMAPTWPCAPQGGKLWSSYPPGRPGPPPCLSSFTPHRFIKHLLCTPTGAYCLLGENNAKQMNY